VALDLSAGNGCMLMNPSDKDEPEKLWDPISVSIDEVLWEMGPNNTTSGIFWERRMSHRVLFDDLAGRPVQCPRLQKPSRTSPKARSSSTSTPCGTGRKSAGASMSAARRTTADLHPREPHLPLATPRYFRVPGETYGRGPVMLAMPSIKTAQHGQAAAAAGRGDRHARDLHRRRRRRVQPGPVEPRAGHVLEGGAQRRADGPIISRFPDPRLDLSGLVVENMQMDVKATMMDQALPVEGAAVKSATEILERVKRLAPTISAPYGRLVREIHRAGGAPRARARL
jgi:hypothetical protein